MSEEKFPMSVSDLHVHLHGRMQSYMHTQAHTHTYAYNTHTCVHSIKRKENKGGVPVVQQECKMSEKESESDWKV